MRILLIEDNPGDAFLIKFYLEESVFKDARLIHAEFLRTAIDLLSKNEFDVILLDLNLPDSKGIETLKEVLTCSNSSVIIVLTGLNDEELGLQTVKLGAQDFLVKGQFDGKVFTSSVRYAFERYNLQRQVDDVNNALNKYSLQFSNAQQMVGFGYWELKLKDNTMVWSDHLYDILGVQKTDDQPDLRMFLDTMKGVKGLEETFMKAIEGNNDIDMTFAHNGYNLSLRSNRMENEKGKLEKLAGVLQKC